MTNSLDQLFDEVPAELASYFELVDGGLYAGHEVREVNLLPAADAVQWTSDFRDYYETVQVLGGVILDDPNTSNHHVYLVLATLHGCCAFSRPRR